MNARVAFPLLSVAVLAFACGPRLHSSDASANSRSTRTHARSAQAVPALAASLDVAQEDGVRFDFRVTNAGDRKIEVNFPNGQTHEVIVFDERGREVWRWSRGRMFTQALRNHVLRSSDTLSYEERWRDAPRGRYVAVASLASANFPVEQRAEFVVR